MGDKYLKLYLEKHKGAEAIPLYEIMGNKKFYEFNQDTEAVYAYCLEEYKTWEEVLGYEYDPNVMY